VPTTLKLNGSEETFTIQVRYDTKELYGQVAGTRKIMICRD